MNYVHDFLLFFEIYQPLLCLGLERGIEVAFIQRILVRVGEKAVPLLKQLAEHSDPSVRLLAINPLTQIGSQEALDALKMLNKGSDSKASAPAKGSIRLHLLGPARIFFEDKEITHANWVRIKSRDLFIYLAHLGSPVDKDRIMEAIWPETPFKQANSNFHAAMHNLRSTLENQTGRSDLIQYRAGRYHLLPGSIGIDKQDFQDQLAAAGNGEKLSERSASLLEEAAALYHGPYLDEMDYSWIIPSRNI
jgi:two-component SAPR family response regulator